MSKLFPAFLLSLFVTVFVISCQKDDDSIEINALKQSISALQKRSDSLAAALSVTNTNVTSLSKSIDSIKVQLAGIVLQISNLNSQLTQVNANIQSLTIQITLLNQQYADLLIKLNQILTQLSITNTSLSNGLVAYYPFTGNAGDSSGNGNHGTVFGATNVADRFGNIDKAFSFNGSSNYITVPFSSSINSIQTGLTMSAWIYMEGGTGSSTPPRILEIRANGGPGTAGFVMLAQNNSNISRTLEVRWYNNSGATNISVSPTNSVPALSWHHVAFTCDGNTATGKFYIDGVLANTNTNMTLQGAITSCNYNNYTLYLGAEPNLLGKWGGKLDEIRLYNRALTQSEITYLANH